MNKSIIIRMTKTDHFSGNVVSSEKTFYNYKEVMFYVLDFITTHDAVIGSFSNDWIELFYYEYDDTLFDVVIAISDKGSE